MMIREPRSMSVTEPRSSPKGRPTRSDWMFLGFIGLVMASTAMLGRLTYGEGIKTNITKTNAETVLAWLVTASPHRQEDTFEPAACRGSNAPVLGPAEQGRAEPGTPSVDSRPDEAGTWRACREALAQAPFVLSTLRNPFTEGAVELRASCDPTDRSTRGAIVIQKLVATPAGSAYPFVVSPLTDRDSITRTLTLRVDICDRNGNAITSGQREF